MNTTNLRPIVYCKRCVMSTASDFFIEFDDNGVCNHCLLYNNRAQLYISSSDSEKEVILSNLINDIKQKGKSKKYDCIIGVSGGVDSTYVAYLVKNWGLRPLAVHCDNGWNSELAVSNINNVLKKLNIDLYTHVINWEEFKDLQLSYLKASVIDLEAISDHAITATLYNVANKKGIKYILSGENLVTEGYLPSSWVHLKNDLINIRGIHKKFGSKKLRSYPTLGYFKKWYLTKFYKIECIQILNYITYNKSEAQDILIKKLDWRDYGGKHYESIITRFYQSYILPNKFGIDKRVSHFSTLICSGQMTREEAMQELSKLPYNNDLMLQDKKYVIKKLGLTDEKFDELMSLPIKSHADYPSVVNIAKKLKPITRLVKKFIKY